MAASAISDASTASATVQGEVRVPATTSVNAVSSARKASANRSMKNCQGSCAGNVDAGVGRTQRQSLVQPGSDGVLAAEQLETYVVAATVGAGVGDHRERPAAEREHRGRGLGVAGLGDVVDPLGRADGVHLHDLLPGRPPDESKSWIAQSLKMPPEPRM